MRANIAAYDKPCFNQTGDGSYQGFGLQPCSLVKAPTNTALKKMFDISMSSTDTTSPDNQSKAKT